MATAESLTLLPASALSTQPHSATATVSGSATLTNSTVESSLECLREENGPVVIAEGLTFKSDSKPPVVGARLVSTSPDYRD